MFYFQYINSLVLPLHISLNLWFRRYTLFLISLILALYPIFNILYLISLIQVLYPIFYILDLGSISYIRYPWFKLNILYSISFVQPQYPTFNILALYPYIISLIQVQYPMIIARIIHSSSGQLQKTRCTSKLTIYELLVRCEKDEIK